MHVCITHAASHACTHAVETHTIASPISLLLGITQLGFSSRDPADLDRGVDSGDGASVGSEFHLRLKIINIGRLGT